MIEQSRFFSIKWKAMLVFSMLLVAVASALTTQFLGRLDARFQEEQLDKREQFQLYVQQQMEQSVSQFVSWMEAVSFASAQNRIHEDNQTNFIANMDLFWPSMQLHLFIDTAWLYAADESNLTQSWGIGAEFPFSDWIGKIQRAPQPQYSTYCSEQCQTIVALPVMGVGDSVAVLAFSTSMASSIVAIRQMLDIDVAVLSDYRSNAQSGYELMAWNKNIVSISNRDSLQPVLEVFATEQPFDGVINNALSIAHGAHTYLFTGSRLNQGDSGPASHLILIEDISEHELANKELQKEVIIIAFFAWLLTMIFSFVFITGSSKRLLNLATALPMLARHQFNEFRSTSPIKRQLLPDELDVLLDSAHGLGNELEELDGIVRARTKELEKIAMYDLLTELPNRNMLNFELENAIANVSENEYVGIIFLDLDDFKRVNDSSGHGLGDSLLCEVAQRLQSQVKMPDIACRFGGDEFVILLPRLGHIEHVQELAEAILNILKEPIEIELKRFYMSTSMGIAITNDNNATPQQLLSHADIAMYQAKSRGGNKYRIYDEAMYQKVMQQVEVENDIRQAIRLQQFCLFLQPQIDIRTHRLVGFEALIRWRHPEKGLVGPNNFIPDIEDTEHIIALGYWIFDHAIELLRMLSYCGFPQVRLAVNLSAAQFSDPELVSFLADKFTNIDVPTDKLELELTERILMDDIDGALPYMKRLKALGFGLSMDDFGTGYSSLNYLTQMPLDIVKIDKSFIDGIVTSENDRKIVESTISMVRKLNMQSIAEGVETVEQLDMLKMLNCEIAQGYYICKPIDENEVLDLIRSKTENGIWRL